MQALLGLSTAWHRSTWREGRRETGAPREYVTGQAPHNHAEFAGGGARASSKTQAPGRTRSKMSALSPQRNWPARDALFAAFDAFEATQAQAEWPVVSAGSAVSMTARRAPRLRAHRAGDVHAVWAGRGGSRFPFRCARSGKGSACEVPEAEAVGVTQGGELGRAGRVSRREARASSRARVSPSRPNRVEDEALSLRPRMSMDG